MRLSRNCTKRERERLEALLGGLIFELSTQSKLITSTEGVQHSSGESTDFTMERLTSLEEEEFNTLINSLTDTIITKIFEPTKE